MAISKAGKYSLPGKIQMTHYRRTAASSEEPDYHVSELYLAEFVAETLRAALTSQGAPLTDEENTHLLGANYWVQPIYQELLHAASGHNASVTGRKEATLVKIMAKQRQNRTRAPVENTACVL